MRLGLAVEAEVASGSSSSKVQLCAYRVATLREKTARLWRREIMNSNDEQFIASIFFLSSLLSGCLEGGWCWEG